MDNFGFDEHGRIVIQNYSAIRPFASFLPGIAGPIGIPMWVFIVNRGQAIASFGVENKDNAIMEYRPANNAYQTTPLTGFRTFLKFQNEDSNVIYEPFAPGASDKTNMFIGMSEVEIEAINEIHGLQTKVLYFGLPGEDFAALVREVHITNLREKPISIELLDGMAQVVPYGTTNGQLKHIGRTIEAWMEVFNLQNDIPFYHLRASAEDTAEVRTISAGHFYFAFIEQEGKTQLLNPIVDPILVFGQNSSLIAADQFSKFRLAELQQGSQITMGRTPCGFFGTNVNLAPGETQNLFSMIGHVSDLDHFRRNRDKITHSAYFNNKRVEARNLVNQITQVIETHTKSQIFDAYCRQTFLDNVLRGGWPLFLGDDRNPAIYHVYSRKHGDLERDYNDFFVAAEMYSQGNGNYRDVNQNRRSDVLFNPSVKDYNLRSFLSLIQADGYNPLVVNGARFRVPPDKLPILLEMVDETNEIESLMKESFTPGQLMKIIINNNIQSNVPLNDIFTEVIAHAEPSFEATFVEGYWIDHWTYILDLIDSYLYIYPDQRDSLLFDREDIPYFDSEAIVRVREHKYVLVDEGVRQYGAVHEDEEKAILIASRENSPNLVRTKNGFGEVFHTTVFAKLFGLALLKFTTLDPMGIGIEMEAGKPSWYDALNGLPGLFGSSLCETYELVRLLNFLHEVCIENPGRSVSLPIEQINLLNESTQAMEIWKASPSPDRDHHYWDTVSNSREAYRARTRMGFDGRQKDFQLNEIADYLTEFISKTQAGLRRGIQMNEGLPPTYISYTAKEYKVLTESDNQPRLDEHGRPLVRVLAFEPMVLPPFLEGLVHALRLQSDKDRARKLYYQVRDSGLYDRNLKMYKVNGSLEGQSYEIGRARVFTPGWLENESIWLHMEYKYLLEVLRAGLYEEFSEDLRNVLIPFQDPAIYGRSPLENSSFIVSSAHPDKSLHGAGFVARLSGATAEFLSIWNIMMAGKQPFSLKEGQLQLSFKPILPGWLFPDDGKLSFKFLGECTVIYHNPTRADTFAEHTSSQRISLMTKDGKHIEFEGTVIPPPFAGMVRIGEVESVDVHLDFLPGEDE